MKSRLKKYLFAATGLILALLVAWLLYKPQSAMEVRGELDEFASCVGKEATMYGADWCGHCQNQKKMFEQSFRLVKYVECPQNTKLCLDLGIKGYPTWIFSDESRVEGEITLESISEKTACPLPTDGVSGR
ncbi:MAG: hypothetical protein HY395_02470 [Candidatus Doudnabacteria bacterium]|nr:hypothetical protein [Candidatus Doudnabacteria bacterium]